MATSVQITMVSINLPLPADAHRAVLCTAEAVFCTAEAVFCTAEAVFCTAAYRADARNPRAYRVEFTTSWRSI